MNHFSIFLLISSLLFMASVQSQGSLTIYTEQFPPYNYLHENQITGINVELTRALCKQVGIDCYFEIYPWNRAYKKALNTQNSGLISTSRHPEREMFFKWVGPIISSSQRACLYKLRTRTDIGDMTKSNLQQYTVAINRNDIYHRILTQWGLTDSKNFLFYANKHDGIDAFKRKKIDLLLGSPITLGATLQQSNIEVDDIVPVFHVQDPMLKGNFLALNRSVTDDLAIALDNALASFDTKSLEALINRFVPPLHSKKSNSGLANICF